jgi:hypothetical protein
VRDELLEKFIGPALFAHMDSDSFTYFLPTYMGYVIRNCDLENSEEIASSVIGYLSPDIDSIEFLSMKYKNLNEKQCICIAHFLEYLFLFYADKYSAPIKQALHFWYRHKKL